MKLILPEYRNRLLVVTLFSTAMGFLEAIVVVYLRELYYPEGFSFPLQILDARIYFTEIVREAATLLMLLCVGILAGKTVWEKFNWFLYTFGIWDIFYYIALKLLLNWPETMLTWDILFLIPVTWVGPVLAPVISSLLMIGMCITTLFLMSRGYYKGFGRMGWILLVSGACLIYFSFTFDFTRLIFDSRLFASGSLSPDDPSLAILIESYIPNRFGWELFIAGSLLILASIIWQVVRFRKRKNT